MDSKPLNLAVIGCGRIGRVHAANIATRVPGAKLAAVADVNLRVARQLAEQSGIERATSDYRELLRDPALDAVLICSATDTHTSLVVEAAAARKHVFCEKPIGLDLAGIRKAIEAVERAGIKLQVGFNRRFDPSFARVQQLVAGGKIGTPHIVRITSRDPSPPSIEYVRISGGLPLDMAIHDFDMVRFLTGQEVEEVYAAGDAMIDPEIGRTGDLDTCVTTLRLSGGAIAAIDNSRQASYGYDQRIEVFGSAGMAAADNCAPDRHVLSNAEGVHSSKPLHFFLERYDEAFRREMQEFVSCIRDNRAPSVTGFDGLQPVVIALAALKSLRENRPVRLSEIT